MYVYVNKNLFNFYNHNINIKFSLKCLVPSLVIQITISYDNGANKTD